MIKIRVPATSANLGPGFDCLGLALGIYNTFEIEKADAIVLDNVEDRFNNSDNLFVKAYHNAGGSGIHAVFHCDIPAARGLGSSAAMITAGISAAYLINGIPIDQHRMFELASEMEGHPDNAAPCLMGGLTACLRKNDGSYLSRRLPLHDSFHFTVLIPSFEVSTEQARAILPDQYPRAVAAGNAAHAVLMCEALRTGDFELLKEAAQDQLHEPYRKKLIAEFEEIKQITQKDTDGVLLISGSGSTCLLISSRPLSIHACRQISGIKGGWRILEVPADAHGVEIEENHSWHPII